MISASLRSFVPQIPSPYLLIIPWTSVQDVSSSLLLLCRESAGIAQQPSSGKIFSFSPARIRAEICLAAVLSEICSPFSTAKTSTAKRFLPSVAVVITGCAPRASASTRLSRFAPPAWPDIREMTYLPFSSETRTAGSRNLSCTKGAIHRTAIPVAEKKTSASAS